MVMLPHPTQIFPHKHNKDSTIYFPFDKRTDLINLRWLEIFYQKWGLDIQITPISQQYQ